LNREKILEIFKDWEEEKHKKRKENYLKNREKWKEYQKNWYQKNREKWKEYQKEYYQKNREKYLQYQKEWQNKNCEKIREVWRNHYHRRKRDYPTSIILNDYFEGSHLHHLTPWVAIYIPQEMHKSIPHNLRTGKNMYEINRKALDFWLNLK